VVTCTRSSGAASEKREDPVRLANGTRHRNHSPNRGFPAAQAIFSDLRRAPVLLRKFSLFLYRVGNPTWHFDAVQLPVGRPWQGLPASGIGDSSVAPARSGKRNPMTNPPHQWSKLAEELVGEFRGISSEVPRRSVRRPTRSLAELVEDLMQKHRIGRSSPEQTIREKWVEIVGAANASYSHPVRIDRNLLVVLVAHSVVRNELFHHRVEIATRIRKLPGCATVKGLNLRSG
jgi:Dna[CI] antecedent, DciA